MVRILKGVLVGLILGFLLYKLSYYMVNLFIRTNIEKNISIAKSVSLDQVKEYAPNSLRIKAKDAQTIVIEWKTLKPVRAYLVLMPEPMPFAGVKEMIEKQNPDVLKALILKVDNAPTSFHEAALQRQLLEARPYFYIVHVLDTNMAIPYGRKVNNTSGATEPWKLDLNRLK